MILYANLLLEHPLHIQLPQIVEKLTDRVNPSRVASGDIHISRLATFLDPALTAALMFLHLFCFFMQFVGADRPCLSEYIRAIAQGGNPPRVGAP